MTRNICSITDCDNPVHGRAWCGMHYMRWFVHGDPLFRKTECNIGKLCVDGCGRPAYAKGRCASHYTMAVDRAAPEQKNKRGRRDYQRHSDAYKQRATTWQRAHPDRVKEILQKTNQRPERKEACRQASLLRSSRVRQAPGGGITWAEWQLIIESVDYRCVYCWERPEQLDMEHVIPISRGGAHAPENIVPACGFCNSSKRNQLVEEWLV